MSKSSKIFIAGDYCPVNRVEKLVKENNHKDIFNDLLTDIYEADYSIVNLECVITSNNIGIEKTGPKLKAESDALKVLKDGGFDMVTLANNHIMDYGDKGLQDTIDALKDNNIDFIGAGMNYNEASQTRYINLEGHDVAIVNISENEFSTTTGIYPGAHPLNIVRNHENISIAAKKAQFVIVIIHGGHEMYQLPSPRMKETYRFYAQSGASVIINHHQHCYTGYEIYNGTPIFYGIGNFIFDGFETSSLKMSNPIWNEGFCVNLIINNKGIEFELIPYIQNHESPGVRKMNLEQKKAFDENIKKFNEIIADDKLLEQQFLKFCKSKEYIYNSYFEPFSNKITRKLKKMKILPSFFTKYKKKLYLNLIRCEAHRDVILYLLKNDSNENSNK